MMSFLVKCFYCFLSSNVAVVLGPWCVVHRSTWQVNEELGGPAKIRDGGFVGVWEPLLCGHSSASSTDEVSGPCFHSGSHRLGESDAGVLQPSSFPSQQFLQLCWHLLLGCDLDVLTPWPFTQTSHVLFHLSCFAFLSNLSQHCLWDAALLPWLQTKHFLSLFGFFCCCDGHHNQKLAGEERVFLDYTSPS